MVWADGQPTEMIYRPAESCHRKQQKRMSDNESKKNLVQRPIGRHRPETRSIPPPLHKESFARRQAHAHIATPWSWCPSLFREIRNPGCGHGPTRQPSEGYCRAVLPGCAAGLRPSGQPSPDGYKSIYLYWVLTKIILICCTDSRQRSSIVMARNWGDMLLRLGLPL